MNSASKTDEAPRMDGSFLIGSPHPLGWWKPNELESSSRQVILREALFWIHEPFYLVKKGGAHMVALGGTATFGEGLHGVHSPSNTQPESFPIVAYVAPCPVENLGDSTFCKDHGIRYPYLAGSMANGISSCEMLEAMAQGGMLGFFGAAGLPMASVESAIDRVSGNLMSLPYGFNLIHSPHEPGLETALVDLYLRRGVRLIEASAFLDLTLPVVRFRVHGIHRDHSGNIVTPNRIIAKASRVEVASKFFAPPPDRFLRELVFNGNITEEQAEMASLIPMAQDLTAEADSGGHTDNRPAISLLPTILALRDRLQARYDFQQRLRVGMAGGIATPSSAAAAFSMGAAYIMTGSVNQACSESGTSDAVREMLAQAQQADVTMAPAADMFEMGVTVQVLKRGTMFAMRAAKLHEIYRSYNGIHEIPTSLRENLEKSIFQDSLESIWEQTRDYFFQCDIKQIERAEQDPKHRMALIFRWYLGKSSHWANCGDPSRRMDYQIWCGPAMGAFNEWVKGSFLEHFENRKVLTIALNLLHGAAVIMRLNSLRYQGIWFPSDIARVIPLELAQLKEYLS